VVEPGVVVEPVVEVGRRAGRRAQAVEGNRREVDLAGPRRAWGSACGWRVGVAAGGRRQGRRRGSGGVEPVSRHRPGPAQGPASGRRRGKGRRSGHGGRQDRRRDQGWRRRRCRRRSGGVGRGRVPRPSPWWSSRRSKPGARVGGRGRTPRWSMPIWHSGWGRGAPVAEAVVEGCRRRLAEVGVEVVECRGGRRGRALAASPSPSQRSRSSPVEATAAGRGWQVVEASYG